MRASGEYDPSASFFMDNWPALEQKLDRWANDGYTGNIYLIGVTHALLRWVDSLSKKSIECWSDLKIHVFETGGMKGKGPELIRSEVHKRLGKFKGRESVCSEYGMTELLSQAWSKGDGIFEPPVWMQVMIGAFDDPGEWKEVGQQGRLHVIDLANISTCSFLSTGDIGRLTADGGFEVLGRYDHSEVRGCNLMAFNL
jgi:acyl-CoA synthetase (AMP-forming)/AMP-acid ligase II